MNSSSRSFENIYSITPKIIYERKYYYINLIESVRFKLEHHVDFFKSRNITICVIIQAKDQKLNSSIKTLLISTAIRTYSYTMLYISLHSKYQDNVPLIGVSIQRIYELPFTHCKFS